jgi:hypothetical protein
MEGDDDVARAYVVYLDTRDVRGDVVQIIDSIFSDGTHARLRRNRINTHEDEYVNMVAWVELEDRRAASSNTSMQRNAMAKLTHENVEEIRRRRAAGERVNDLAAEFNIARNTIGNITSNRSWTNDRYMPKPKVRKVRKAKLKVYDPEVIADVREMHERGVPHYMISKKHGIGTVVVSNMVNRKERFADALEAA